jgi:hypothetical protein
MSGFASPFRSKVVKPGHTVPGTGPVELTAVAGGEKYYGLASLVQSLEGTGDVGPAQRKPLPVLYRCCMVAYTNDME